MPEWLDLARDDVSRLRLTAPLVSLLVGWLVGPASEFRRETLGAAPFFCLSVCWLVAGTHPEGPATDHLDTGFLGFPLSKQMLRRFPSSKLLLHASYAAFLTKIYPSLCGGH
jgi:hypothetical protein